MLKIRRRNLVLISFQIALIVFDLCALKLLNKKIYGLNTWGLIGLINIVISTATLCCIQQKIFTGINLFFLAFWLFQFGLPLLYLMNSQYENYYISLFSSRIHVEAAKYTVISIAAAAVGLSIGVLTNAHRGISKIITLGNLQTKFSTHKKAVARAGFLLFILTAMIVIPVTTYAVIKQILSGTYSTAYRDIMSQNNLFKFSQEFFYSSALLCLCFEKRKYRRRLVATIFVIASVIMLLLADRAQGLAGLLVLFFFQSFYSREQLSVKDERKKQRKFIIIVIVLAFIMEIIAVARLNDSNVDGLLGMGLIGKVFEELGFNFTSICFVMDYIPGYSAFRYGATYLASFVRLIPSSLDFLGVLSSPALELGESWLFNMNHAHKGDFLDFGVGFSIIAESYLNFSWLGLIIIPIICIFVAVILKMSRSSEWSEYVQIIMLMDLLLLPRRQFYAMLKSWEYSVLFMGIYLVGFIGLFKMKYRYNKNEDCNGI